MGAESFHAAESAFKVLDKGIKYVDYTAYLLRCLQAVIRNAKLNEIDVSSLFLLLKDFNFTFVVVF